MLTISSEALEKAKKILEVEGKSDWGLRVFMAGSSCCGPSFGMDINEKPSKGDDVIEKDGLKLFVEKSAHEKMDGMEIHFVDDGEQSGFVIRNTKPSAAPSSCNPSSGCSSC